MLRAGKDGQVILVQISYFQLRKVTRVIQCYEARGRKTVLFHVPVHEQFATIL